MTAINDLSALQIGDKVSGRYTHLTDGTFGTFSRFGGPTVKPAEELSNPLDYLDVPATAFEIAEADDPKMIALRGLKIEMLSSRILRTNRTIYDTVVKETSREEIEIANYKYVSDVGTNDDGEIVLTACPNASLIQTKVPIKYSAVGGHGVSITRNNVNFYFAVGTDKNNYSYIDTNDSFVTVNSAPDVTTMMATVKPNTVPTATDIATLNTDSLYFFIVLDVVEPQNTLTSKEYSISIQTGDGTTPSQLTHDFNWVYFGKNHDGRMKFIADRVIHTNVSLNTIVAGLTAARVNTGSFFPGDYEYRLPFSATKIGHGGEWDEVIGESSINGTEDPEEFWGIGPGSFTANRAAYEDDVENDASGYIVRGRGGDPQSFLNVEATATSSEYGFRPVLLVKPYVADVKDLGSAFTDVGSFGRLGANGTAISCEYTAATAGTLGTFSNLGKATKKLLSTSGNATPDGTFYFVKIGTTNADEEILVADRVIHTNIPYTAIASGLGVITIDGKSATLATPTNAQYNAMLALSASGWNDGDAISFTDYAESVLSGRGKNDGSVPYTIETTESSDDVGFRPVLIIAHVAELDGFKATPKVVHAINSSANKVTIEAAYVTPQRSRQSMVVCIEPDDTATPITYVKKTNTFTTSIQIPASDLEVGNNNLGLYLADGNGEPVSPALKSISVTKEDTTREQSIHTINDGFGGFKFTWLKAAQAGGVDVLSSYHTKTNPGTGISEANLNRTVTKVQVEK